MKPSERPRDLPPWGRVMTAARRAFHYQKPALLFSGGWWWAVVRCHAASRGFVVAKGRTARTSFNDAKRRAKWATIRPHIPPRAAR